MTDTLRFDPEKYELKTYSLDGRSVTCRAYMGILYCAHPADPIQKLNLFVPEVYYQGESINGYTLHSAPIYMPNTVGGYLQGPAMEPGMDRYTGNPNTAFEALCHGYIAACAGIRGRNTGEMSEEFFVGGAAEEQTEAGGKLVGRAPAFIVDMKAAIRYIRHNRDLIPGDTERIITNGTSAGGALSALTGASGNAPEYQPYLDEIGAAAQRDDIFAASCYCPIHNLENADSAYEWLFLGNHHYRTMKFGKKDGRVFPVTVEGVQTQEQIRMSGELALLFPDYLNSLELQDQQGRKLTLDSRGKGSFREYVKEWLIRSAQRELETHDSETRLTGLSVSGSAIGQQEYLTIREGTVTDLDWDAFVRKIGRMKTTPAFDAVDLDSPECEEFGDEKVYARHFTPFSTEHDTGGGEMAGSDMIRIMNPLSSIGSADTARHWRIRHGSFDRDTSLAIPVILATILQNKGFDVDFALPWGLPHSGDYDLQEQFAWIDSICRQRQRVQ